LDFESVPYLGDRSGLLFEKFHIDGPFSPEKVVSAQFGLFIEQVRLSEFEIEVTMFVSLVSFFRSKREYFMAFCCPLRLMLRDFLKLAETFQVNVCICTESHIVSIFLWG
jgi:hypothetical protein